MSIIQGEFSFFLDDVVAVVMQSFGLVVFSSHPRDFSEEKRILTRKSRQTIRET